MRKRNRLYKKHKRNKTVEKYEPFKNIRNNVTSSLRIYENIWRSWISYIFGTVLLMQ